MEQDLGKTKCFVCGKRKATRVIATIPVCKKCGDEIESKGGSDDK
jgi:ribosomal protein L37AE/L43A